MHPGEESERPVDVDGRSWRQRLIAACERVAENVPDPNDPNLRKLLQDVDELRARLTAELRTLDQEA